MPKSGLKALDMRCAATAGLPRRNLLVALGLAVALASPALVALPAQAQTAPGVAAGPNSVVGYGPAAAAVTATATGLPGPLTGVAATPDGAGYWAADTSGQVTPEGSAVDYGSVGAGALSAPVVGVAATSDGTGYWLVGSDGAIYTLGDATPHGSTGSMHLNQPVVGMAATDDGGGYWLAAADGGIFNFGNAAFLGSTGSIRLNRPIVGLAVTPDGGGYWLVASDGGIFAFGDAGFYGSTGSIALSSPVVGMAPTPDGHGYWLVAADGGIFAFGDAPFYGSGVGGPANAPAAAIVARPGGGYWVAYSGNAPLSSPLGQEEALATLGYLPLTWTPAGFAWRWAGLPASLTSLWVPGQANVVLNGAIRAFEFNSGLPMDGAITGPEQAALQAAINAPASAMNPNGYSYAFVTKSLPETMTVWHNGAVIQTTRVNTGIPAAPTADGTFPVYSRLRNEIMKGTDPDGRPYADPVQWVAYFNGGDAVHYISRGAFGYPQSLGCVETPLTAAAFVWPYLTYGTLVTVAG